MDMHGSGFGSPWTTPPQPALADLVDGTLGEMPLEPLGEMAEAGFEPQTRARSNTWPLPRPDNYMDPPEDPSSKKNSNLQLTTAGGLPIPSPISVSAKKNSSRRNAWGNLSYADLITQAITSAPDNRLTLSQIYDWMVHNVAYFKDKGDSNSSAGWKNSIRHNLSLHNRFMRVQNEGTGKSSWWMINPDAKPGKSVRRRAASMETSKFEKRRGRVKKKVEALRNGLNADQTPSPCSSVSEGLDTFDDSPLHSGGAGAFQHSPDFRQRASSNASSCGRVTPVLTQSLLGVDADWGPPDFASDYGAPEYVTDYPAALGADQLAGSLADSMKLHGTDPFLNTYVPTTLSNGPTGPPPPYQPPRTGYGLGYVSTHSHCPHHGHQPCGCIHHSIHHTHSEGLSPSGVARAGHSPAYPAGAGGATAGSERRSSMSGGFMRPAPPASPPRADRAELMLTGLDSQTPLLELPVISGQATTMMGQLIGALSNPVLMDDLNLNIETLEHGGFDCNVDEVIKHELSMEGSLDFNFPQQQQQQQQLQQQQHQAQQQMYSGANPPTTSSIDESIVSQQRPPSYSTASPSWVH